MLLNQWFKKLRDEKSTTLKKKINVDILDSLDTLRISDMIFKILSTQSNKQSIYMNEIFWIAWYFLCKLVEIRPQSIQEKFLGFFPKWPDITKFL